MEFNKDIYTKWAVLEESVTALPGCKMSLTWALPQQTQVDGSGDGDAYKHGSLTSCKFEKK